MSAQDLSKVAVLGAGNMGHGITEVIALAGYEVVMRDIEQEFVDEGYKQIKWSLEKLEEKDRIDETAEEVLDRIGTEVDLESAVNDVDLVIEAAPENMELKRDIFSDLDEMTPDHAILASNTSSLSISEIAKSTGRPDQVCGMHFFNPPVIMDLVEVIYGDQTSDETADSAYAFAESIGKTPIRVRKDVYGFVVNRVLIPFMIEPARMVSAGEAEVREVDAAMTEECGYPMGPFELLDLTGIDVICHILGEADREVPAVMREKMDAEEFGKKSGQGFYDYDDGGPDYGPDDFDDFDTLRVEAMMINAAAWLVGNDVATVEAVDTGVKLGAGFPEGICRKGDKLGLDIVHEKLQALYDEYGDDDYKPSEHLTELVEEGRTGESAGQGFYNYGGGSGQRDYQNINYEITEAGVLEIEIDRQNRLNAISPDLADEIEHLIDNTNHGEVRCVTFEGAGDRAFSAGADINKLSDYTPAEWLDFSSMTETVADFPRPTIALIDGFCLGGGFELALACDLRIATRGSEFGFPEINLGIIPGMGGTQRLQYHLGEARTKEMIFRGRHVDAEQMQEWGVINHAVDPDEFEEFATDFVGDIATGPPIALRQAKKVVERGADASRQTGINLEKQAFGILQSTEDMDEGVDAFNSDRDPEFRGE